MNKPADFSVQQALERLRAPRDEPEEYPDLRWARRIMARHQRGEKVSSAALLMARQALGIKTP